MPPPGAGKQSSGNEEEQKTMRHFATPENQNKQNNSEQPSYSCGQVMSTEVTKKSVDFIEVHILTGSGAGDREAT